MFHLEETASLRTVLRDELIFGVRLDDKTCWLALALVVLSLIVGTHAVGAVPNGGVDLDFFGGAFALGTSSHDSIIAQEPKAFKGRI